MTLCETVKESVIGHLSERIVVKEKHGDCVVSTPFLDVDNDSISVFIRKIGNDEFKITDYGSTIGKLVSKGVIIDSKSREALLYEILGASQMEIRGDILEKLCTRHDLGDALLLFVGGVKEMGDLALTLRYKQVYDFRKTVKDYLREQSISFSDRPRVKGKYLRHRVDFGFRDDRIVAQTLQALSRSTAKNVINETLVEFIDLKEEDPSRTTIAIYNDQSAIPETDSFTILEGRVDHTLPWARRGQLRELVTT